MTDDPFPGERPHPDASTPAQHNEHNDNAQPSIRDSRHPTNPPNAARHHLRNSQPRSNTTHPQNNNNSTPTVSTATHTQRPTTPLQQTHSQIPGPTTATDGSTDNLHQLSTTERPSNTPQWQQVTRARTRIPIPSTPPQPNPPLRKSSSRTNTPKQANKFAPLDFEILRAFDDDEIAPIEITLSEKPLHPPRRKYRATRKALPKLAAEAVSHQQQIRHPANTLQHLSPKQAQVVLRSKNPSTSAGRDNLIKQIALLRVARANTNTTNITLDPIADSAFIQQVQSRVSECPDTPNCEPSTDIDIPISAILGRDETKVRGAINYARIDLASRAILPHLYDAWPDPPTWNGATLRWLPSTDGEVPCLEDEALALLAACSSLQNVWSDIVSAIPPLQAAIQTASTQWHMFTSTGNPQTSISTLPHPNTNQ